VSGSAADRTAAAAAIVTATQHASHRISVELSRLIRLVVQERAAIAALNLYNVSVGFVDPAIFRGRGGRASDDLGS
jgi:hypothetical protein